MLFYQLERFTGSLRLLVWMLLLLDQFQTLRFFYGSLAWTVWQFGIFFNVFVVLDFECLIGLRSLFRFGYGIEMVYQFWKVGGSLIVWRFSELCLIIYVLLPCLSPIYCYISCLFDNLFKKGGKTSYFEYFGLLFFCSLFAVLFFSILYATCDRLWAGQQSCTFCAIPIT